MKVLFNALEQSVSIEGDGPDLIRLLELVREIAPNLPQITIQAEGVNKSPGIVPPDQESGNEQHATTGETLRQFARKLSLSSNSEKIAAIAYYKREVEKVESFTPKEMGDWFTMCGFQKPQQMPVAVHSAKKRNGYIESAGHSKWKLSTNGVNLVVGKLNQAENGEE